MRSIAQLREFEEALAGLLPAELARKPDQGFDMVTHDGVAIEVRQAISTRDLHAALVWLAMMVKRHHLHRGVLVALLPRMRSERVADEWSQVCAMLIPEVRHGLGLVAIASDTTVCFPEQDSTLRRIKALSEEALGQHSEPSARDSTGLWSSKQFEVWRILLAAWLRQEPPLQLQQLESRSGVNYSTVKAALTRLEEVDEIARETNRSISFASFPRRSVEELLPLIKEFRQTEKYVDTSGRPPDPQALERRLQKLRPAHIALGGVRAARHYTPDFDLNGLPRVDVTVHRGGLNWITRLNPALKPAPTRERSPLLVVHRLDRPEPLFDESEGELPYADPAETMLDLFEIGLASQAEEFAREYRARKRHV